MPQSTSRRLPAASTRYLEPVTVPAAPRNVSLGIGVSFYRNWRRPPVDGEEKDNAETRRAQRSAEKDRSGCGRETDQSRRGGAQQCCAPTREDVSRRLWRAPFARRFGRFAGR